MFNFFADKSLNQPNTWLPNPHNKSHKIRMLPSALAICEKHIPTA